MALRELLSVGLFPTVFFGALTAAIALLHDGWAVHTVPALVVIPAALIILAMERVHPYAARWSTPHDDVPTDWTHLVLSQVLPPQLLDVALVFAVTAIGITTGDAVGLGLWPTTWSLPVQLMLAMVVGELGQYAWHRLCHEHPWFWRWHAVHHSAPRLYWLNAGRFHPLDTVVAYSLTITPLVMLGCPAEVLMLSAVFTAVHGMFQHANLDIRLGPLNWVFSMAELHRWHHSRDLDVANANYGANLIVWDIVFGTRKLPAGRLPDPADVGFEGDEVYPQTYLGQVAAPFRRPRRAGP